MKKLFFIFILLGSLVYSSSRIGVSVRENKIVLEIDKETFILKGGDIWGVLTNDFGNIYFGFYRKGESPVFVKKIISSEITKDAETEKVVNIIFSLASLEGDQLKELSELKLKVEAKVIKNIPGIFVKSWLINEGEGIPAQKINALGWVFFCKGFKCKYVYGEFGEYTNWPAWGPIKINESEWFCFTKEKEGKEGIGIILREKNGYLYTSPDGVLSYTIRKIPLEEGENYLGEIIFIPTKEGLAKVRDVYYKIKMTKQTEVTGKEGDVYKACFLEKVRVDGDLEDWEAFTPIVLDEKDVYLLSTIPYKGLDDLSCRFWLGYDKENLYLACEVKDDVHFQVYQSQNIWQGDSIQISFDTLNNKNISYDEDDYEFGFALSKEGVIKWCWHGRKPGPQDNIEAVIKRNEDKKITIYELKIPFESIYPFKPFLGQMGFTFLINDNDGSGRKSYIGWVGKEGIGNTKNPSLYGKVIFEGVHLGEEKLIVQVFPIKDIESGWKIPLEIYIDYPNEVEIKELYLNVKNEKGVIVCRKPIEISKGKLKFELQTDEYQQGRYFVYVADGNDKNLSNIQSFYVYNLKDIKGKLKEAEKIRDNLKGIIEKAKERKLNMPYIEARLNLLEDFILFTEEYLNKKSVYLWAEKRTLDLTQGEIRINRLRQGNRNADYLVKVGLETIKEAEYLLSYPDEIVKVPEPELKRTNLRLEKGNIYCKGEPVLLIGPLGWGMDEVADKIKKYGFNSFTLPLGYTGSKDDPNKLFNQFIPAFNTAKEYNLLLHAKFHPYWLTPGKEWGYTPIPVIGSDLDKKFQKIYPEVGKFLEENGEYLFYVHLINEPRLMFFDEDAQSLFREYLKREYKSIEELNNAWKTEYKSFEEIKASEEDKSKNITKYLDFLKFTFERSSWFLKYMDSLIKKGGPSLWTSQMYMSGAVFYVGFLDKMGIDYEDTCEFLEIKDMDSFSLYPSLDEFSYYFIPRLVWYDIARSINPEKPMTDGEYHFIQDSDPKYYPYQYCYTSVFQGFLHGIRGAWFWVWERGEVHREVANNFSLRAEATDALSRCALDLRRLAKYVCSFSHQKGSVAIFYSLPSIIEEDCLKTIQDVYLGLLFLNNPVWFVTERQILKGCLKDYKVLIVPNAKRTSRDVLQKIIEFGEKGGKIILIGDECLTKDEKDHKVDNTKLLKCKNIITLPLTTGKRYFEEFKKIYEEEKIVPPVKITDLKGQEYLWGVESQSVETNEGILTYIINLTKERKGINLKIGKDRKIKRIIDLISLKEIKLPYTLKEMEILLLKIEK